MIEEVSAADAVGAGVGIGIDENGVDDAEDGGGGADAEGEGEDGEDGGEAGSGDETKGVTNIVRERHTHPHGCDAGSWIFSGTDIRELRVVSSGSLVESRSAVWVELIVVAEIEGRFQRAKNALGLVEMTALGSDAMVIGGGDRG